MEKVHLKIKRQDSPEGLSYWEEFAVPYEPGMNVIALLRRIQSDPFTADGLPTAPVAWEQSCLEEVCGSCAMIINGKAKQACSTLVDDLNQPIVLEPLSKFPVVRDLKVDRSAMFDSLKGIRAWKEVDGLHDSESEASKDADMSRWFFALSSCIMCGDCLEACPQVNDRSPYGGAFIVAQALLHNRRDPGAGYSFRLETMRGQGGIGGCSNAQNCEVVCPKDIPLIDSLAAIQWDVTKQSVLSFLRG